jgi:hypothetical protein
MGWGVTYEGYISRVTKAELDSQIANCERNLLFIEREMIALACLPPAPDEEGKLPCVWLPQSVHENLELYAESAIKLHQCRCAQEDPDAKDT